MPRSAPSFTRPGIMRGTEIRSWLSSAEQTRAIQIYMDHDTELINYRKAESQMIHVRGPAPHVLTVPAKSILFVEQADGSSTAHAAGTQVTLSPGSESLIVVYTEINR